MTHEYSENLARNWAGTLTDEELLAVQREREVSGDRSAPAVELDHTRRKLKELMDRLTEEIRHRLQGEGTKDVFFGLLQGLISGEHVYVEGSSGTAKTFSMRLLCRLLNFPLAKIDATADASDFTIVGGEMLSAARADGSMFAFRRGPLLMPGTIAVVIDELPRLPASASNALLQAMAERKVTISRTAQIGGSQTIELSEHLVVLATGNPVSYAGQGERSRALFDRFGIGMLMTQPPDESRLDMYEKALGHDSAEDIKPVPFALTLWELRRAREQVTVKNSFVAVDDLKRLLAASYAVSPDDFTKAIGWDCPTYAEYSSQKNFNREALRSLRELANSNLAEGSNPRGELSALRNAQTLFLMDREAKRVSHAHLAIGFAQANLARLKPYPNCEAAVREIIARACDLFFPEIDDDCREKVRRALGEFQSTATPRLIDRVRSGLNAARIGVKPIH